MSFKPILTEAAQSVLETMFFAESESLDAPPAAPAIGHLFVEISFHGHRRGRLAVGIPESCARAMTGSFEGLPDGEHIPRETVHQVAAELANMICGATLTRLNRDGLFSLGSPAVTPEFPAFEPDCSASECWLHIPCLGDGLIHLALGIEGPDLEDAL